MSIPKNKLLRCSKGFQAQAEVGVNSPVQNNSQSVNVILSNDLVHKPLTRDKEFKPLMNKNNVDTRDVSLTVDNTDKLDEVPLNDNLDNNITEKSIETATENLEQLKTLVKDKNNLIEALSLILDIYENNPLIINKIIIAQEDELARLILLLTNADSIEMTKYENEIGCCKQSDKYKHISKILVKKGDNTFNFKYSYPNCVQLLENRRISYKICV